MFTTVGNSDFRVNYNFLVIISALLLQQKRVQSTQKLTISHLTFYLWTLNSTKLVNITLSIMHESPWLSRSLISFTNNFMVLPHFSWHSLHSPQLGSVVPQTRFSGMPEVLFVPFKSLWIYFLISHLSLSISLSNKGNVNVNALQKW